MSDESRTAQEGELLRVVRASLAPYPAEKAQVQAARIENADVWHVTVTPTNSDAATVDIAITRSDELVLSFGQTYVYLFVDYGAVDDGLAEMLDAIFAGRFEEAGRPGDSSARLKTRSGQVIAVGAMHWPLPWRWRRSRRYAAYRTA